MKRLITYVVLICFLFVPLVKAQEKVRIEKDLLGEKAVPADAYYGVQTARALENFRIAGVLINHYPHSSKPGPWSSWLLPAPTLMWAR